MVSGYGKSAGNSGEKQYPLTYRPPVSSPPKKVAEVPGGGLTPGICRTTKVAVNISGRYLNFLDVLWLAMLFKAFPIVAAINTKLWAAMQCGLLQARENACIHHSNSFTCDHT
jgi:hypothetical protein